MAGRRRLDRRAHVPTRGARERMRRRIANSGRLVGGWLDLAIDADGSLVGEIDARHPPRAMPPVFEKLGFAKEGVMRSYWPGGESRDDDVLYAVTRADWTAGR